MKKTLKFQLLFSLINLLLFLSGSLSAQVEKIWPTWAQEDGSQFVAQESMICPYESGYVEYVYTGNNYFSFGFYGSNTTLNNTTGLKYGAYYTSSSFYIYLSGSNIATISQPLSVGDVLQIRSSNNRFSLSRNGVELHVYAFSNTQPLYPYLYNSSANGQEELMSFNKELGTTTPTWITNGSWRLATNVLQRGQDGGVEMAYDGNTSSWHLRFQTAKNTDYTSYCLARIQVTPSSRTLYMYYRNPQDNYNHLQSGTWSSSVITMTTDEFYVGAKIRMAREGSNIVFYVNGKEKKRVNTDANIELHPIVYRYYTGQENNVKVTFGSKGGVCQNYFNSKGSYVNEADTTSLYNPSATNESRNYVHTKTFNGEGEKICHLVAESRIYFDEMGRMEQTQSKDMVDNKVWATNNLYDKLGRAAIITLPAPTGTTQIAYKTNFVLDSGGQPYSHDDYDTDTKLNNPNIVGKQSNTLGAWYSTSNYLDKWQATTDYPYSRKDFSKMTGLPRRTSSPGNVFKMGGGKESVAFTMLAGTELAYVFANKHPMCRLAGSSYDSNNAIQNLCNSTTYTADYTKSITEDADGRQAVLFFDRDGNLVATALSGSTSSSTSTLKNTRVVVEKLNYQDVHVTTRSSYSTTLTLSSSGTLMYSIYNLLTDQAVVVNSSASTQSLAAGFYRVQNHNGSSTLNIDYQLNYYDFNLNIHNSIGQWIASVAPKDVVYNTTNPNHTAFTYYKYNSWNQLIWDETPDAGRTYYYYRPDGMIRFSIDAQQIADGSYSYTKYDNSNRIIENGLCTTLPAGDLSAYTANPTFPTSGTTDEVYNLWDFADPFFQIAGYTQTFVAGRLAKTWNDQETIWYSYDEKGRTLWTARKITGAPNAKITEYTYDLMGQVTTVTFQKDQSDEFRHQFAFDVSGRMKSSATRQDDHVTSTPVNQIKYKYTPDGEIERQVIGDGLETQTFAYTLEGNIKAINPEDMRYTDIGEGGRHPFSLALHYYQQDYQPANGLWKETYNLPTTSTSSTYNSFSGNITGARWKTRANIGGADISGHFAYRYLYNARNELYQGYFANITPYTSSTHEGRATYISDYYTYYIYDKNGNMTNNTRRAYNFPCSNNSLYMDNLTYRYDYTGGKNRLTSVDDSYFNNCVTGEITDQNPNNYSYNSQGQLIKDIQSNEYYEYDTYGMLVKVRDGTTSTSPLKAEYFYGPDGKRVKKTVYNGSSWVSNWYARDGENLLAVYETSNACGGCANEKLIETPLYGNYQIGIAYKNTSWDYHYELSDHLGSVRAVIREGDYGEIELLKYTDYYPYGWAMPGRNLEVEDHRNGFQGQFAELDEETGFSAFELRNYNSILGRWMVMDPYQHGFSPYWAMDNNPTNLTDPDGGCPDPPCNDDDIVYSITLPDVVITAQRIPKPEESGGFWTSALDWTQTGLDVLGLVPGFGEIADGANALIYTARGDYTNAALSAAAMIPFAGWGATGAKLVNKVNKAAGAYEVYQAVDKTSGVVKYIGITKQGVKKRELQHLADPKKQGWVGNTTFTRVAGGSNLNKTQARVMEQKLINQHGFVNPPKSSAHLNGGGTLMNKINSISPAKWSMFGI